MTHAARTVEVVDTRSWIEGVWVTPTHRIGSLDDPNTGSQRQAQLATDEADVKRALSAADRLYADGTLETVSVKDRVAVLSALADQLDLHQDLIARQDAIATGNPITTTRLLASFLGPRVRGIIDELECLGDDRHLAAEGREVRVLNRSLGPALILAPWNAPTFVAVSKVAAAFASASPTILKPSEWAPGGVQIVTEILSGILTDAGFPPASVQLVHGGASVGSMLTSDQRVKTITFTGGITAGRAVARAAADNLATTQLELGSNNPAIVLPDADIAQTASQLAQGMTRLNGQWCEAPGKVLVPEGLHDELLEALIQECRRIPIGHCMDDDTLLGPLAFRAHWTRLRTQLSAYRSHGASLHTSGELPAESHGWFMAPTVVTGLEPRQAPDELFGPAVTVHKTASVEDSIRAAQLPGGGLDAFVFGEDLTTAAEVGSRIHAGEVRINGTHMADLGDGSEQSFWGTSGVGGHGPTHSIPFYQGKRVVGVDSDRLPI